LLGLTSGLDRNIESDVCSAGMLDVFMLANTILQKEAGEDTKQGKFMQRQDIKDLITLLFSLAEFSLKTVLSGKPSEVKEAQVGDEEMISTFQVPEQASDSNETDQLLQQHISKSSPFYGKFKTMMSFFLNNKALLNTFIRVNQ
jgi:hypothetical protein